MRNLILFWFVNTNKNVKMLISYSFLSAHSQLEHLLQLNLCQTLKILSLTPFTHTDCVSVPVLVTRCSATVWVGGWCSWTAAPGTAACRRTGYAGRKRDRKTCSSDTWKIQNWESDWRRTRGMMTMYFHHIGRLVQVKSLRALQSL